MRLFIACDIPDSIKESIVHAQISLGKSDDKIKWVEKDNLHLTMKFLGETNKEILEKIKINLSSIKFDIITTSVSGFGFFPRKGNIRVIWAGLTNADIINNLRKSIDSSLERLKIPEESKFKAHITLGRVKYIADKERFYNDIKKTAEGFRTDDFIIDKFILKKSTLTPAGPIYTDIESFLGQ